VPTNFKASLKKLVRLKPNETCHSLKRHFYEGAMREVVGSWEAQLRKYPNEFNFIWIDVPWTVEHTVKGPNKKVSFKERKERGLNYSRNMVGRVYLKAREEGIASRPFEMEIDGVVQLGFVLTPHDALCNRESVGCRLVGPYKIPGTSWRSEMQFKDDKPTGKKSIIFRGFLGRAGHHAGHEVGHHVGHHAGHEVGHQSDVQSGSPEDVMKTVETTEPIQNSRLVSETENATYLSVSISRENLQVRETLAPTQKIGDHGNIGEEQHLRPEQGNPTPTSYPSSSSNSLTKTVRQHFEGMYRGAPGLRALWLVTDGVLAPMPAGTDKWVTVNQGIEEAANRFANEHVDRKTLAAILNSAITISGKLPPVLFKIMKQFQQDGGQVQLTPDATCAPDYVESSTAYGELWMKAFELKTRREAWQMLHRVIENGNANEAKIQARDSHYDADTEPDKPPAPWRAAVKK
jgi:hypothetical protein